MNQFRFGDWTIATSQGFPAELGKHSSNVNTWKENGNVSTFEGCYPSSAGKPREVAIGRLDRSVILVIYNW